MNTVLRIILLPLAALTLAQACASVPPERRRARDLYQEGQVLVSKGRFEKASTCLSESLSLCRAAGDREGAAHNLNEMGILHTRKMELEAARACFQEAEALYRQTGVEAGVSKALNNRALTFILGKDYMGAVETYQGLMDWDEATGNRLGRAITLSNLGNLYETRLHKRKEAVAAYEQALDLLNAMGDTARAEAVRDRLQRLQQAAPFPNE